MTAEGANDALEVVFVCTGNQARSALAEALFRRSVGGLPVRVSSYGTGATAGASALPQAVVEARRLGVDLTRHAARPLRRGNLDMAELVLGFEPFHVSYAVVDARADASRTFLLGELVALLDEPPSGRNPIARARAAVATADARRVRSRPDPTRAVRDPLGLPDPVMHRVADEIDGLVRALAAGLFGDLPVSGTSAARDSRASA